MPLNGKRADGRSERSAVRTDEASQSAFVSTGPCELVASISGYLRTARWQPTAEMIDPEQGFTSTEDGGNS
jgi:hypothetical protein